MAKNKHIHIGQLGEDIICVYLSNRGFRIVLRNYRKKWGEIDIIAEKKDVLHFVEVKAGEKTSPFKKDGEEDYRPEDHINFNKKERLKRVIQTYLLENDIGQKREWTVDVAVVLIDTKNKKASVKILKSVLLD
jgi:putative endonuclease